MVFTSWEAESERANCLEDSHHNGKDGEMPEVRIKVRHDISEITITYPVFPFDGIFGGGGDGGCVCFICGRAMGRGEPFTCVSRLLETRKGSEGKPAVIEAVASLQVCLPCTLLSAHHRLKWAYTPRLTGFEICGFYAYARLLGEAISRAKSDTRVQQEELIRHVVGGTTYLPIEMNRAALLGGVHDGSPIMIVAEDHCHRCYRTIDHSRPHITFEIAIHTPKSQGMKPSDIWQFGRYCAECSNELLPLCDRLWRWNCGNGKEGG